MKINRENLPDKKWWAKVVMITFGVVGVATLLALGKGGLIALGIIAAVTLFCWAFTTLIE